jgi:hypothetical protein
MNIVTNAIDSSHKLNVFEIGILKIYLISVSFLLSIWFPKLLAADTMFYVVIFVVLYFYFLMVYIKKEGNYFKKFFKK